MTPTYFSFFPRKTELFDLPLNLTAAVLASWLSLKDLAALDIAECNWYSRATYFNIIKSAGFVLDDIPQAAASVPLLRWVIGREIKIRRIHFGFTGADGKNGQIATFLGYSGRVVKDVSANDAGNELLVVCCLATLFCDRLRILQLRDCKSGNIASIIRKLIATKAPTLERLALEDGDITEALPEACIMDRLKYLSFKRVTATSAPQLCMLVRNCHHLLYFYTDALIGGDDCLHALAQSCPCLVSLHYGYNSMSGVGPKSTAGLEAVLLACKDLHTVDFTSFLGFTNAHVAAVARHCRKLTALRLMLSTQLQRIDQDCVAILAPRLPQLRLLHLSNLRCTSATPISLLAQHCHSLADLELRSLCGVPAATEALVALFSALPSLAVLNLSHALCLSDAVLTAIGRNCPRLASLNVFWAAGFTEEGISEIARGCAALDVLTFEPDYSPGGSILFSRLVRSLWRVFRPNLKFITTDKYPTRWDDIRRDV